MGFYIPKEREQNLRKYSYSGHDGSLLSKYVLTPYWNNLVKIFPIFGGQWDPLFSTTSPLKNAASLGGRQVLSTWHGNISNIENSTCPPSWIYFSLDAIDGKQARRTGSSSPLGEVFDHGCDAINTTHSSIPTLDPDWRYKLEVLLTAAAINLGMGWWTVASQLFTLANFYLTTWEEYHTGVLYLSAFSGPVEGPGFWDQGILTLLHLDHLSIVKQLHIKNLPLNECFLTFGAIALVFNISSSYGNVYKATKKKGQSVITPLLGLLPFVIHSLILLAWLDAVEIVRTQYLLPFAVFWGLSFAYQVGLLITAHVSKGPFPYFHVLLLWSAFGSLDANLPRLFGRPPILQSSDEKAVIYYGKPKPAGSFEKEPQIPDRKETAATSETLRQRKK
ncbi:hypothetical protein EMMF5_004293 [Cystobasidiomycetes sp. EMM_F5]